MSCSTCGHTMAKLTGEPGHGFWHCERCGTVSEQMVDEDGRQMCGFPKVYVPKLVERCRDFEQKMGIRPVIEGLWHSTGVRESINPPERRPK